MRGSWSSWDTHNPFPGSCSVAQNSVRLLDRHLHMPTALSPLPAFLQSIAPLSNLHVCMHAKSFQSFLTICDPMTLAHQAPLSMGFSRKEYWSELPFPFPYLVLVQKAESDFSQILFCLTSKPQMGGKVTVKNLWLLISDSHMTFPLRSQKPPPPPPTPFPPRPM